MQRPRLGHGLIMATPEKMVNVRQSLPGGPLHIEIEIPATDAKAKPTRKYLVVPEFNARTGAGVEFSKAEWDIAAAKPMVKALIAEQKLSVFG